MSYYPLNPFPRVVLVLVVLMMLPACHNGNDGTPPGPQPDTPQATMTELSKSLHEDRKTDALSYIVLGSQDYYDELFTTIGTTGMDRYGSKLDALGLASQTSDEATFTGQWTINAKTLNVTAILIKTGTGKWKLVEVR